MDELGKGTEVRAGAALAGALMEELDRWAPYFLLCTRICTGLLLGGIVPRCCWLPIEAVPGLSAQAEGRNGSAGVVPATWPRPLPLCLQPAAPSAAGPHLCAACRSGCRGIFATHLHALLDLELQ